MSTKGMLVKSHNSIEIKARQRLGDADVFDALIEELLVMIEDIKTSDLEPFIEDLDISQNRLSALEFETLFQTLANVGVHVQRFRIFGCPTLDDEALGHLSNYFRTGLMPDTVPTELHLSDCAITNEGFMHFIEAIEDAELYPFDDKRTGNSLPLYLRLENNYIDEAVIQDKVDAGVIRAYTKPASGRVRNQAMSATRISTDAVHKVDLVVMPGRPGFQQKEGPPPAPEDVPAPKPVNDEKDKGKGKGNGKDDRGKVKNDRGKDDRGKGKHDREKDDRGNGKNDRRDDLTDRDSRGGDRERARDRDRDLREQAPPPPRDPRRDDRAPIMRRSHEAPTPSRDARRDDRAPIMRRSHEAPQPPRDPRQDDRAPIMRRSHEAPQPPRDPRQDDRAPIMRRSHEAPQPPRDPRQDDRAPIMRRPHEGSGRPRSRSRGATGSGRITDNGVRKPSQPPRPSRSLPAGWEEHWSDQYKRPYFWNPENGDSSWDRPTR